MNEQGFIAELQKLNWTEKRISEVLELYHLMIVQLRKISKEQADKYTLEEHLKGVIETEEKYKDRPDDIITVDG